MYPEDEDDKSSLEQFSDAINGEFGQEEKEEDAPPDTNAGATEE
jgi:hypothetical protein